MTGDTQKTQRASGGEIGVRSITILALLLVLYPLSAGPIVYLQTRTGRVLMTRDSLLSKYFYPLQQAQIRFPPFMRLMQRYGWKWRDPGAWVFVISPLALCGLAWAARAVFKKTSLAGLFALTTYWAIVSALAFWIR